MKIIRFFKIDSGDGFWKYRVYENKTFLGINYWKKVYSTDHLILAKEHIESQKEIPIYIDYVTEQERI